MIDLYGQTDSLLVKDSGHGNSVNHPDLEMELDISVYNPENVFIFHDHPFRGELSWIEYDAKSQHIDFIMNDGDLRNFGIPVSEDVGKYLKENNIIHVVLREGKDAVSEITIPLITHH